MPRCASSRAPTLRSVPFEFGAEQLDFHALGCDRGGVQRHERPGLARRTGVNGAGHLLLAGAGRADDHDAAVGRRDALDGLAELAHRRRHADEIERLGASIAQFRDFALQLRCLQCAIRDQDKPIGLEWLLDEIIGAAADRGYGRLDIAVAGYHHNRKVGVHDLDLVEQRKAVETRSLQPDIQENQTRHAIRDRRQRAVGVVGHARLVTFIAQNTRDELANVFFVIYDKYIRGHCRPFQSLAVFPRKYPLASFRRRPGQPGRTGLPLLPCRRETPPVHRGVPASRHGPRRSS